MLENFVMDEHEQNSIYLSYQENTYRLTCSRKRVNNYKVGSSAFWNTGVYQERPLPKLEIDPKRSHSYQENVLCGILAKSTNQANSDCRFLINSMSLTTFTAMNAPEPIAQLGAFQPTFFDSLYARRFHECEAMLSTLATFPSPELQQAAQHYRAVLLSEQRQFDQAELLLRALLPQSLTDSQRANTLLELAIQLDELGQWQTAFPLFQEALTLYTQRQDDEGCAKVYTNLGISLCFQVEQENADVKELPTALTYHQTALSLAEKLTIPDGIMRNLHGLGRVYGLMGQYTQAEQTFQQQLILSNELGDENAQAVGLADLATLVYLPQGRLAEAEETLQRAVALLTTQADDLHLAETLTRLGNLYVQQGADAKALALYEQALQAVESLRSRLTAPIAKANYRATTEFIYTAPLTLHLQRGNAHKALTLAERARARVLADLLAGQNAQPHQLLPAALLAQRQALRTELEQAYSAEEPAAALGALEDRLATLDRQIELLDAKWLELENLAALTADEIQQRLPQDAALVSYVSDAAHQLHCLLVTPQKLVHLPLNPQLRMSWLQAILPDHLSGQRQGFIPNRQGQLTNTALFSQLYQALLQPLLPYLNAVKTVYLVPTGALNYLPLGALTPSVQIAPPLLADGRRVVFAPSATVLFHYCHQRPSSSQQGVVVVAPKAPDLHFIQGAAATLTPGMNDHRFVGESANRQTFLTQTGTYRVICFLGHALFNTHHPMLSYLNLSDTRLQAGEILRELRIDADLVVLAACETGRTQILRGDEILGLSRALLYAGAPAILVTAWKVHELSTRLLIEKFFAILTKTEQAQKRFDPAGALAVAQNWLRSLTYSDAYAAMHQWPDVETAKIEHSLQRIWIMQQHTTTLNGASKLFDHPFFWAPYMLIGEPAP